MDVFCDPREITRRYERYVIDLRRLFLFHGLGCGAAENFPELGGKLEESRALRLDLPALLRNIRDLEGEQITADEMLTMVALASGGEELVEGRAGSAGLMRTVGLLQMMLAGVGTWAETNGAERVVTVRDEAGRPGEERVGFELALEELRLQLGEVKRRMRELEPQGAEQAMVERPVVATRGLEALGPVSPSAPTDRSEPEEPSTLRGERWPEVAEEAERAAAAAEVAAQREMAERLAAEQELAERVTAEREMAAARAAAQQAAAAERAAAEQAAMLEGERARAWPLEERVSALPAIPRKPWAARTATAAALEEASAEKQRGRSVRLAAMAAGLLLATVGIYGSLRSGTARAGSVGTAAMAPLPAGQGGAVAPSGGAVPGRANGESAGVRDAGRAIPASPAAVTAVAGPTKGRDPVADGSGERTMAAKALPAVPARSPVAAGSPVATVVPERRPVVVAAPAGERRPAVVVPVAVPEERARNRRDDAAVEAALAERPAAGGGKFLFVPTAVMETHLVSSRKPVVPAEAKAGPARVVLNAFIAKDGTVSRTDVVEGPPELINSAMAAVSWRRYRPFLVKGEPAAVMTPVVVSYGGR